MYRSTEILWHALRGAFESLLIRRKKIDVDFTVTDKERMHYEWYDVLRQYVRRKPPRLVISQQNLGMANVVIRLV